MNEATGFLAELLHGNLEDGAREFFRRIFPKRAVYVRQMAAIQPVEIGTVRRIVFRAVPPAPIAAFGNQQFFKGQPPVLVGDTGSTIKSLSRLEQIFPSLVVLFGADPYIDILIDPRAGKDVIERLGLN